jgi:hypothetical protein
MSNPFSALFSSLSASGVAPSVITSAMSALGGALNTVKSQVDSKLSSLATLVNNPTAYAAASPGIINEIEGISGLPPTVLPLLEELRAAKDPLIISELITQIEAQA